MTHDFTIVLGERIVTPGAIVQVVFQARLIPMTQESTDAPGHNFALQPKDERHQAFWSMKNDAEEIAYPATLLAHAPQWRAVSAFDLNLPRSSAESVQQTG